MINKNVFRLIDASEVVSFDVFDTLVVRNVSKPTDVFKILDCQLKRRKLINQEENFFKLRLSAQRKAYEKKQEVTLFEIYSEMDKYSKDEQRKFIEIELEIEKKICIPNIEMFEVYTYCLEKNKKIIIASDMYLSQKDIVDILEKCGYCNFSDVYVSSQYGKRKSIGTLFGLILKKEQIKSRLFLHIGDNFRSDCIMPKLYGMKSYHYSPRKMKEIESGHCQLDKICINYFDETWSEYFKFGYIYLGALMYQFTMWLDTQCKDNDINKLYFLSREGCFLKECYKRCFKEQKSEYVYLSRKTVRALELMNCDTAEKIVDVLELRVGSTIQVFFEKCGLKCEDYKNVLRQFGYSIHSVIIKEKMFYSFVECLKGDIQQKAKEQYDLLCLYLKQKAFFDENIALVDIGWKGTMQQSLSKLPELSSKNIKGFYFGTLNLNRENVYGFLEDCNLEIEAGMTLFETLFMATHGTTIGYIKRDDGFVQPHIAETEFSEQDIDSIRQIQEGALHYLDVINNIGMESLLDFTNDAPRKRFLKLAINPDMKYINLLQGLTFFDSYKSQLVCSFKNVSQIKSSLIYSGWKIAFLKKILRFDFIPYLKLYFFLKKKGTK